MVEKFEEIWTNLGLVYEYHLLDALLEDVGNCEVDGLFSIHVF